MTPGAAILGSDYLAGFFPASTVSSSPAGTIGKIDFTDNSLAKWFIKSGETARYFHDIATIDDVPIDLTGSTIVLRLKPADGTAVKVFTGDSEDPTTGALRYLPITGDLVTEGDYQADWLITLSGGNVFIYPFDKTYSVKILPNIGS